MAAVKESRASRLNMTWNDLVRVIARTHGHAEPADDEATAVLWEQTAWPMGDYESVVASLNDFYRIPS